MEEAVRRPLIWLCGAYILGIIAAIYYKNVSITVIAAFLFLLLLIGARRLILIVLCLAAAFAGVLNLNYNQGKFAGANEFHDKTIEFSGRVTDISDGGRSDFITYRLDITYPVQLAALIRAAENFGIGDTIKGQLSAQSTDLLKPQNTIDLKAYYKSKGIHLSGFAQGCEKTGEGKLGLLDRGAIVRRNIIDSVRKYVPYPNDAILSAVATGDKSGLTEYCRLLRPETKADLPMNKGRHFPASALCT